MTRVFAALLALSALSIAQAGYIIEIDTDGADDGVLTFNDDFAFGNDTTAASQSAPSTAYGTTGGDSIFGGDGTAFPDTYVYTYAPDSQADNLVIPAGQDLGEGNIGTGLVGGGQGTYRVYATWPITSNVSGGLTTYEVVTGGDSFTIELDQNGRGHEWALLGDIEYTGGDITVTQLAGENTFVSMRAHGVLFELIPEPTSLILLISGALLLRRR